MSDSGRFNLLAEALAKSRAKEESKKASLQQASPQAAPQVPEAQASPQADKAHNKAQSGGARGQSGQWAAVAVDRRSKKEKKAAARPCASAGDEDWTGVGLDTGGQIETWHKTKGEKLSGAKVYGGTKTEPDTEAELFALAMSGVDGLGAKNNKRHESVPEETPGGLLTLADKFPAPSRQNKSKSGKYAAASRQSGVPADGLPGTPADIQPGTQRGNQPGTQSGRQAETQPEDTLTWDDYLTNKAENPELEKRAFSKAMQGVAPLSSKGRELHLKPDVHAAKVQVDHNLALQELIDGKLEFSLEYSGEFVECQVVGLDSLVLDKLKAGQYSPEAHVDLHGQNAEQAHTSLLHFIRNSYQRNLRNVIVVTGRGLNSPNGVSVLRDRIQSWLTREPFKRVVLAFCTARAHDGGPGALYVLLRKYKKSRGKIFWDRIPTQDELDG